MSAVPLIPGWQFASRWSTLKHTASVRVATLFPLFLHEMHTADFCYARYGEDALINITKPVCAVRGWDSRTESGLDFLMMKWKRFSLHLSDQFFFFVSLWSEIESLSTFDVALSSVKGRCLIWFSSSLTAPVTGGPRLSSPAQYLFFLFPAERWFWCI